MTAMRYRLSLDLGAKSLGWAMLRLNEDNAPIGIIKAGVRIFSDGRSPKDGSSLAVTRRQARQMRRRRDRFLRRRERLSQALMDYGFFPQDDIIRRNLIQMVLQTFVWVSSTLSRMVCQEDASWKASNCISSCLV